MSLEQTKARHKSMVTQLGKTGLNAIFPNDFESYLISLELTDSSDRSLDFFTFPITPDSISISEEHQYSLKKTVSGITAISNPVFEPYTISISGSFGKAFKFLLGARTLTTSGFRSQTKDLISSGGLEQGTAQFSPGLKTGFGCIKVLQSIFRSSRSLDRDTGKPIVARFYNTIFSETVVVKLNKLTLSQDSQSNMLPNYEMTMTAIAPISVLQSDKRFSRVLKSFSKIASQKAGEEILSEAKTFLQ